MKVTSVTLFAPPNTSPIVLSFKDPSASGRYLAESIDGLDADDLMQQYYATGASVGKMHDVILPRRDVVILMSLNPRFSEMESYSDLRDAVYRLVSSSRTGQVLLQFNNGETAVAGLVGHISKVEAPQSSRDSKVKLTITCGNPMLQALERTVVDISGLNPTNTTLTDLASTAPHGFQFRMSFLATVPTFSITDASSGKAFSAPLTSLGGFKVGDIAHYSSERGNKYFYVVRAGVTYHLIDKLTPGSIWPMMFPGENQYTKVANMKWDYISYIKSYWGV